MILKNTALAHILTNNGIIFIIEDEFDISGENKENKIVDNITKEQQKQLTNLLEEYCDIFAYNYKQMGCSNFVEHTIETGDATPIYQKA